MKISKDLTTLVDLRFYLFNFGFRCLCRLYGGCDGCQGLSQKRRFMHFSFVENTQILAYSQKKKLL